MLTSDEEGAKVQDSLLPMTLEELQKEYKKSKPSKVLIKHNLDMEEDLGMNTV